MSLVVHTMCSIPWTCTFRNWNGIQGEMNKSSLEHPHTAMRRLIAFPHTALFKLLVEMLSNRVISEAPHAFACRVGFDQMPTAFNSSENPNKDLGEGHRSKKSAPSEHWPTKQRNLAPQMSRERAPRSIQHPRALRNWNDIERNRSSLEYIYIRLIWLGRSRFGAGRYASRLATATNIGGKQREPRWLSDRLNPIHADLGVASLEAQDGQWEEATHLWSRS